MSLIDMMLGKKSASADIAKDRLTVMLAVGEKRAFFASNGRDEAGDFGSHQKIH